MTPISNSKISAAAGLLLIAAGPIHSQTAVRMEAEEMRLDTYEAEAAEFASNGALINLKGPGFAGSASASFPGASGLYDVAVVYHDENDGLAQLTLSIAGQAIDFWTLDQRISGGQDARPFNRFTRESATAYSITEGDDIRIEGLQGNWDHANVDFVEFTPTAAESAIRETLVAKQGGDYETPQEAVDDMANWCRPPFDDGAVRPSVQCVIRIGAGIFPLQRTLRLEPDVSLIGTGAGVTVLAYTGDFAVALVGSPDFGASISLRDLTIEHTASGAATGVIASQPVDLAANDVEILIRGESAVWGLRAFENSAVQLNNVTVLAQGGTEAVGLLVQGSAECVSCRINAEASNGIARGIQVWGWRDDEPSSLDLAASKVTVRPGQTMIGIDTERLVDDVSITDTHVRVGDRGDGRGIVLWRSFGFDGRFLIHGSTIDGGQGTGTDYGVQVLGGGDMVLNIDRSTLAGSAASVMLESGGTDYRIGIGGSKLDGPVSVPGGASPAVTCAGVYDRDYRFYADSCPE